MWGCCVHPELRYGPVAVKQADGSTRVGYYDDDDVDGPNDDFAVVYYCEPPFLFTTKYQLIEHSHLTPIDTDVLWQRRQELQRIIADHNLAAARGQRSSPNFKTLYPLVIELMFVSSLLSDRLIEARRNEGRRGGSRVFISHSSVDKQVAVWLSVDLASEGHLPWLDEWEIRAGESIPVKIAHGIDECDYMLVLLSASSVNSGWVEAEWSTKYWAEVQEGRMRVVPVLLSDCEMPSLLRTKRYADLRTDYGGGLDLILESIR